MGMNLNSVNTQNFFKTGIVSGQELTQVSQEILGAGKTAETTAPQVNFDKLIPANTGMKLTGAEAAVDSNMAKKVMGLDVKVSSQAMAAINSLNAQASVMNAAKMATKVDGKLYIPTEKTEFHDLKSVFTPTRMTEFHNTSNLGKDKKGSDNFMAFASQEEEINDEGLDLVI